MGWPIDRQQDWMHQDGSGICRNGLNDWISNRLPSKIKQPRQNSEMARPYTWRDPHRTNRYPERRRRSQLLRRIPNWWGCSGHSRRTEIAPAGKSLELFKKMKKKHNKSSNTRSTRNTIRTTLHHQLKVNKWLTATQRVFLGLVRAAEYVESLNIHSAAICRFIPDRLGLVRP